MALLQVSHETRYTYSSPVQQALHLAHLKPLQDAQQQVLAHALHIEPGPNHQQACRDAFGNDALHFHVLSPHREMRVRAVSRVRLCEGEAPLDAAASPPWEQVRDALRYEAGASFEPAVEFVQPSRYVPFLPALKAFALPSFSAGRPLAQAALELMQRIHEGFAYRPASTDVHTPLEHAFAQREGVCQDFAHLLVGMLRVMGLPARYVSGYLLTQPPPGGGSWLGADASHAWAQAWCPRTPGVGGGWLSLDPTNAVVPSLGHVRLAVGRDYADVAPLRGVIHGGGRHSLSVAVQTSLLSSDDEPATAAQNVRDAA
jgi:transglutaminase-like putative cysteine protease